MTLNIKSADVIAYFEDVNNFYDEDAAEQRSNLIADVEKQYLKTHRVCSAQKIRELNLAEYNIDYKRAKKFLEKHFDSQEVMKFTSCWVMSNAYFVTEQGDLRQAQDIAYRFTNLHRIGGATLYGLVLRGMLEDKSGFYTLKISQAKGKVDTALSLHELVVGIHLNKLRELGIPNFVYTYGAFQCSRPILDETGKVLEWCSKESDDIGTYVMLEDIENGVDPITYLSKHQTEDAIAGLALQVSMSSRVANDIFEYTHYDLHPRNLLMRTPPPGFSRKFYIPYRSKGGTEYYVLTDRIATVIDYGSVFVKDFGTPEVGSERFGKYNDRSFPLHDIFRLLGPLCKTFFDDPKFSATAKNYLWYLLRFFADLPTPQAARDFVNELRPSYYNLPFTLVPEGINIENFIDYVLATPAGMRVVTKTPRAQISILRCRECWNYKQIFREVVDGNIVRTPETFADLYREYLLFGTQAIPQGFDVEAAIAHMTEEVNRLGNASNNSILALQPVELTMTNYYSVDTLNRFRNFCTALINLYDLLDQVVDQQDLLKWTNKALFVPENAELKALQLQVLSTRQALTNSIKLSLDSVVNSIKVIDVFAVSDQYRNLQKRNTSFDFYTRIYPNLVELAQRRLVTEDVKMKEVQPQPTTKRSAIIANKTGTITRNKTRPQ